MFITMVAAAALQAAPEFSASPFTMFDMEARYSANVALADMDGDGDLDVLLANGRHWAQPDFVYLNDGKSRLLEAVPVGETLAASYALLPGDLDGDGDMDAVAVRDSLPVLMFENDGKGRMSLVGEVAESGGSARGALLEDLDGDGRLDLVIARRGHADLLYRGSEAFLFAPPTLLPDGRSTSVDAGDLDGDGDMDLAFARRDGDESIVLLNEGADGWRKVALAGSAGDHRKLAVADMDGDGLKDVVLASTEGALTFYRNEGGTFAATGSTSVPSGQVQALVAGDVDGDGDMDLVAGGEGANALLLNDGAGVLTAHELPGLEGDSYGLALGDMNGDGKVDVVVANSEEANIVLRQR
ncbi:FG-GAP repeat domain-containing protein [Sphingomicrobium aestuariivivum]|uniref:FG-GAP repeat domain-containing protein n=1 Tax=Sphingomicrobium aestuariivivum TaxID=1582356 RepID=UPI001FD649AC|nr:VCBS repeat-containing protein [Sphingomicrobium aestuariivivum]MCJ8191511.1 VCBS repeat-containing protein [Sphingomicrobium aestuariivivum]